MHAPVGGRRDHVSHAVAVDVGELRARLDRRAHVDREAGQQILVEPVLLVDDRDRATRLPVDVAVGVVRDRADSQRDGAVVLTVRRVRIARVRGVELPRREHRERRLGAAAGRPRRHVAHPARERLELRVRRLHAGRPLDEVVVALCARRRDAADDGHRRRHAVLVEHREPGRRNDVDLRRDEPRVDSLHRLEGVGPPVPEALREVWQALVEPPRDDRVGRSRLGHVDHLGVHLHELHQLFGREGDALVERLRIDEPRDTGTLAGRFARAGLPADAEHILPAVVGAGVERDERRRRGGLDAVRELQRVA